MEDGGRRAHHQHVRALVVPRAQCAVVHHALQRFWSHYKRLLHYIWPPFFCRVRFHDPACPFAQERTTDVENHALEGGVLCAGIVQTTREVGRPTGRWHMPVTSTFGRTRRQAPSSLCARDREPTFAVPEACPDGPPVAVVIAVVPFDESPFCTAPLSLSLCQMKERKTPHALQGRRGDGSQSAMAVKHPVADCTVRDFGRKGHLLRKRPTPVLGESRPR